MDWITGTDLSEEDQYEQAVQQLDIENFTSFIILELWAGDTDWGAGNRMQRGCNMVLIPGGGCSCGMLMDLWRVPWN